MQLRMAEMREMLPSQLLSHQHWPMKRKCLASSKRNSELREALLCLRLVLLLFQSVTILFFNLVAAFFLRKCVFRNCVCRLSLRNELTSLVWLAL